MAEITKPSWNIPDLTPEELIMDVDKKMSSVIYDITNVAIDLCSCASLLMTDEAKYTPCILHYENFCMLRCTASSIFSSR